MADTILSVAYDMIKPHLKPEHDKWVLNNGGSPEAIALGNQAHNAAHGDSEVIAAKNLSNAALDKVSKIRETAPNSPEHEAAIDAYQPLNDAHGKLYAKKFAEHLGNLIDQHIATAPQREAQERVAKATEEGKNQPIVKKPNGKFVAGCLKCQGSGVIPRFGNTADGMCFDCKGVGFSNKSQEHDSAEELRKLMVDTRVARAQGMPVRNTTSTPAVAAPAPSERPKGFTNKFPGTCVGCGTRVGKGEGMTSKGPSDNWEVRCVGCHHG